MQNENFVSLWLGNLKSSKNLEKYLKIEYTADGDFTPSAFAKDFEIRRYDDDIREAEFFENPSDNIAEMLEGFSYDSAIIKYFENTIGEASQEKYNTVILLYNFEYKGPIKEITSKIGYLKFIESTKYRNP